jgi:hypothetical protein
MKAIQRNVSILSLYSKFVLGNVHRVSIHVDYFTQIKTPPSNVEFAGTRGTCNVHVV